MITEKAKLMLCPFCLANVAFEVRSEKRRNGFERQYLACGECAAPIPRMYADDYDRYPPVVVSSVGFTQHGKTAYYSSLFYLLRHLDMAARWPGFSTLCLNDQSLDTVWKCVDELRAGKLPDATPKMFPSPTILRLHRFPGQPDCTLILFDTAGESFRRPQQLIQYARFVQRASTVLLFVSLPRLSNDSKRIDDGLFELLETYVVGAGELGTREACQRLVVVFTMADMIGDFLGNEWSWFRKVLIAPASGDEVAVEHARASALLSRRLGQFTADTLKAHSFQNLAHRFFRETVYCLVSSLGAAPSDDNTMATCVVPRRVLDPLVHVIGDQPVSWRPRLFSWLFHRNEKGPRR